MFKLRCKRHYRNLATYSWCTTWREHVTKTAPARRRHSVGGGAAAAAHSAWGVKPYSFTCCIKVLIRIVYRYWLSHYTVYSAGCTLTNNSENKYCFVNMIFQHTQIRYSQTCKQWIPSVDGIHCDPFSQSAPVRSFLSVMFLSRQFSRPEKN